MIYLCLDRGVCEIYLPWSLSNYFLEEVLKDMLLYIIQVWIRMLMILQTSRGIRLLSLIQQIVRRPDHQNGGYCCWISVLTDTKLFRKRKWYSYTVNGILKAEVWCFKLVLDIIWTHLRYKKAPSVKTSFNQHLSLAQFKWCFKRWVW